jgi:mono/diheme cytochrome c family protein
MTYGNVLKSMLAVSALYFAAAAVPVAAQQRKAPAKPEDQQVQRGRYLVKVTGCNDCHTAGYAVSGGKVPEAQWLTGDRLGWSGPWGTTYPANLRLYMAPMTEKGWVQAAKSMKTRPPMPWFALHDMTEQDLKAIYRYVAWLGPAGEMAPTYVPPGKTPLTPVVQFPSAPN